MCPSRTGAGGPATGFTSARLKAIAKEQTETKIFEKHIIRTHPTNRKGHLRWDNNRRFGPWAPAVAGPQAAQCLVNSRNWGEALVSTAYMCLGPTLILRRDKALARDVKAEIRKAHIRRRLKTWSEFEFSDSHLATSPSGPPKSIMAEKSSGWGSPRAQDGGYAGKIDAAARRRRVVTDVARCESTSGHQSSAG